MPESNAIITMFGMDFNVYAIVILAMLFVFLFMLFKAQRAHRLNWMDMITRDGTKVSTTKILQLVGGVVATWVVIKTTIQGALTWDLFAIYLAYVASIDGFSKFIMARYGAAASDDSRIGFGRGQGRGQFDSDQQPRYNGMQQQSTFRPPVVQRDDPSDDEFPNRGSAKPIE